MRLNPGMENSTTDTAVHAARRERLRARLAEAGHKAILISHAANRYYLSGFELHDPQCNESAGMLCVTRNGPDILLTDPRFLDAARRLWPEEDIFIYAADRYRAMGEFLKGMGLPRILFEARSLTYDTHARLSDHIELVPSAGFVEDLRLCKDQAEIDLLRRSCAVNHAVLSRLPDVLVPGMTEAQAAWEIEKLFREGGASELSFPSIVAVDENAALPHAVPGPRAITDGCLVLVDVGGRVDGYCSDQTRTFWVGGTPSDRFRRTVDMVREAQDAALAALRPGLTHQEAFLLAQNAFATHGVAAAFTHSLGHGIGLETHEPPSLSPYAEGKLAPGMVVTVEPGLYYPDWGGVRWEYMVLVTDDGAEIL
ncbi:M24 family metallopeptidase [Desulfolutivibrio sulfoxidireducens]|uniref:M24 family metallopeptidase n=1 Tax=Desulfolutivibrio sulfoxidireducens TaxID=2773299 RepID=UPI00210D21F2|nr:aminopeptidase P family protein [Desulfolutivibrio sulfoxidireducens]